MPLFVAIFSRRNPAGQVSNSPLHETPGIALSCVAMYFVGPEEKSDFGCRRFSSVGSVHGVLLDVFAPILTDGTGRRLGGISGPHDFSIFQDGAFTVQYGNKSGARRHVRAGALEKRPFFLP